MSRIAGWFLVFFVVTIASGVICTYVDSNEWLEYRTQFGKNYGNSAIDEANAKYYYAYNKILINNHNTLYDRGQKTFRLKINQFTDMRLIHFNALFPPTTPLKENVASPAPATSPAPTSYDVRSFGYQFNIEDQGVKCNSGWAYAAVKAIEILKAQKDSNFTPAPLSAQNIIDCSGRTTACKSQVPQTAYDYLAEHGMNLNLASDYINQNALNEPGMCVPKGTVVTQLAEYAFATSGNEAALKSYVGSGIPVVIEFNPTSFEFMHYSEGIYQPPRTSTTGSHYMVVIGYETAADGKEYWILQNSFGRTWGENGIIRVQRSLVTLSKNAILPTVIV